MALTCASVDSQGSQHVCWFPSKLKSLLTPFKKLTLGYLRNTSADIRRGLPTEPSLFKSDYFPLISQPCEMGSHERAQFMVHWAAPRLSFFLFFLGRMQQWRLLIVFLNVA